MDLLLVLRLVVLRWWRWVVLRHLLRHLLIVLRIHSGSDALSAGQSNQD